MVKVKGYISSNFTKAFLTIFLPFYLIISLVYLVKIASLTSKIKINFIELLTLYSYSIPDIVFYTLPLSFITALSNVLMRLSLDNELIALYALGMKAKSILKSLVFLGLLFSLLLLTISFLAMPLSKQYKKHFITAKKSEAKLNIIEGKLGQKFGDFYIYVQEKENDIFKNIVIYNRTDKSNEQFFSSKTSQILHQNNITSLLLYNGYGYTYSAEKLQQVNYETLKVFHSTKQKNFKYYDLKSYWGEAKHSQKRMHKILFFTFVSLIPILSVYLIASFTMINPRYQPNHSFIVIFIIALILYIMASTLQMWGTPLILMFYTLFTFFMGQWLFHKRVSRFF